MLPELPGELMNKSASIASCSWIVFCVGVCRDLASMYSVRPFGVLGVEVCTEELDP
jgi:hypothetical protein